MRLFFSFLFLLGITFSAAAQAPPIVVAVSPTGNSIGNSASTQIFVDFAAPVSVLSVNSSTFQVFGRWSGPMSGSFSNQNNQTRFTFTPSEPFFAGEQVFVTLNTGITTPTVPNNVPMDLGYSFSFWVGSIPTSMTLYINDTIEVRRPGEGYIQSYGAYAGDLNNDGYSDLAVVNESAPDIRTFENLTDGDYVLFNSFESDNFSKPSPNEGADFDQDGEIDLVVVNTTNDKVVIMRGDGALGFVEDSAYTADDNVRGVAVLDLNSDGWTDVVTTNRLGDNLSILLNNGDGTFGTATNIDIGSTEWSICSGDANEDGLMDIFVGCEASLDVHILLSDGAGNLTANDVISVPSNPWMMVAGDVNGDGHIDVTVAGADSAYAMVILGDGTGQFTSVTNYTCGGFPVAIDLGDLDGDGDLDMVTSNYVGNNFTLFENDGSGTFINPVNYGALQAGSCAIFHDRDDDGDVDMTGIDELDDVILIFDDDSVWTNISVAENDAFFASLNAYPNPTNASFTLEFELKTAANLRIFALNELGQEVSLNNAQNFTAGTHQILFDDADHWPSGIYFVRIVGDGISKSIPVTIR